VITDRAEYARLSTPPSRRGGHQRTEERLPRKRRNLLLRRVSLRVGEAADDFGAARLGEAASILRLLRKAETVSGEDRSRGRTKGSNEDASILSRVWSVDRARLGRFG